MTIPSMTDDPPYRIDPSGQLLQHVRPGPRTPVSGYRRLGRVLDIQLHPRILGWIRIQIARDCTPPLVREITILAADLVDERGAGPGPDAEVSPQRAGQVETYPGWLT